MEGSGSEDRFETLAVHAGADPDPLTGAVVPAIQMSATFKQDGVGGTRLGYEYGRSDNPTRRALETAIAALEGAPHGLAYASGLAATQNVFYLLDPGDRLLMSDDVYGGTWRLAERVWRRYGIETRTVDLCDLDAVAASLNAERAPRMVWIETPTNPLLKVVDISAVARLSAAVGALTVVDNTFGTPYLQRPLDLGADAVLHSTTKYLGGHSDVIGGAVATRSDELAVRLRFHQNAAGAVPSVHYPGLPDHPQLELVERQMRLPGAIVSVELADGEERAKRFVAATRLFTLAESLGAGGSPLEPPAALTHLSVAH